MFKKVTLISNMYPSLENPSKGIFVYRMSQQLQDMGVIVERVTLLHGEGGSIVKLVRYVVFYFKAFYNVLTIRKSDVVYVHFISHSGFPILLAYVIRRLLGLSTYIVANVHGGDVEVHSKVSPLLSKLKSFIARRILRISHLIVSPSKHFSSVLTSLCDDIPDNKIFVVPSGGVNMKIFQPKAHYSKPTVQSNYSILFLSRLEPVKRPLVAVEAVLDVMSRNPQLLKHFSIVGDGSLRKDVESLVQNISDSERSVTFDSTTDISQTKTMYASHDFYILLSETESLGLTPLEAMASGSVVILSSIPSFQEYVNHCVNGYLVSESFTVEDCILHYSSLSITEQAAMRESAVATVSTRYSSEVASYLLGNVFKGVSFAINS